MATSFTYKRKIILEPKTIKFLKTFKILAVPGQRLDRPCDKIKFLKISVVLHFAMKNRKMARQMTRDSVPKNSRSIANRVFKKLLVKTWDDYAISFSEVVRIARFICQKMKEPQVLHLQTCYGKV